MERPLYFIHNSSLRILSCSKMASAGIVDKINPQMAALEHSATRSGGHAAVVFCALSIFDEIGGIQRFNQRIVGAAVDRLGDEVQELTIISLNDTNRRDLGGAKLVPCRTRRAALIWEFVKHVSRRRPIIILLGHINLLPLAFLARCLNRRSTTALFVHGVEVWNDVEIRRKRWYERRLLTKYVDLIISVSKFTDKTMKEQYALEETAIRILANAIDIDAEDAVYSRHAVAGSQPPRLISVTRLAERMKGIEQVLHAVAKLRHRIPGLTYEVVGEGPLKTELMALARGLAIDDIVKFRGQVSETALVEAFRQADIFVLPSQKEGFGIVFLEAWKYGLPVICGNVDASAEVVIDGVNGITIDPTDIDALASAIERLAGDPQLRLTLAKNGFERARQCYSNEIFATSFRTILSDLICRVNQEK